MAELKLSAFADEYADDFAEQLSAMRHFGIDHIELRHVDKKNVSVLTVGEVKEAKEKLDFYGIGVSAIGSPIGKIKITDPMEPHLDKLKQTCETAEILGTRRIRMFSFYIPDGKYEESRNEVIDRMGQMLDVADQFGMHLCHENEKGIYGDIAERCLDLLKSTDGRLGCVFDPANFIQSGCEPFPHAFNMLKHHITYMHIKDAVRNGTIVVPGHGIGCLPEIMALLNKSTNGEIILTVEPHLRVFAGLDALESGTENHSTIGNTFATAEEAFGTAITWTRYCLPRTAQVL